MSSLLRTLARIREDRAAGRAKPKKLTPKPESNASVFSDCGPGGARREHPLIEGLQWLHLLGCAIVQLGNAWNSRVSADNWENDGCVSLHLHKPVQEGIPQAIRAVGATISPGTTLRPIGGGEWWTFRIPVGAVNNQDANWVLREVLGSEKAEWVMTSSPGLRAMHGLSI